MSNDCDGDPEWVAEMGELIPLKDVPAIICELTGGRKRISVNCVYRWARRGARGRVLRARQVGGHLATTRAWIEDFLAERKLPGVPIVDGRAEHERAIRRLRAKGVKV